MSHVHCVRRRTPASVQEKRFTLFHIIENFMHVPMGEKDASPQEVMYWLPCDFLYSPNKHLVYLARTKSAWKSFVMSCTHLVFERIKLTNKFVIVNAGIGFA